MLVNKILEQEPKGEPRVFITHGQDEAAKLKVARFIEEMGMTPVILAEQANIGRTVIEKFEQNTDVCFAVVILTPDDTTSLRGGDAKPCFRARQNVILELGYFFAKLGRKKVCALHKAQVEIPSDIHGVLYIPMDEGEGWKMSVFPMEECLTCPFMAIPFSPVFSFSGLRYSFDLWWLIAGTWQ